MKLERRKKGPDSDLPPECALELLAKAINRFSCLGVLCTIQIEKWVELLVLLATANILLFLTLFYHYILFIHLFSHLLIVMIGESNKIIWTGWIFPLPAFKEEEAEILPYLPPSNTTCPHSEWVTEIGFELRFSDTMSILSTISYWQSLLFWPMVNRKLLSLNLDWIWQTFNKHLQASLYLNPKKGGSHQCLK